MSGGAVAILTMGTPLPTNAYRHRQIDMPWRPSADFVWLMRSMMPYLFNTALVGLAMTTASELGNAGSSANTLGNGPMAQSERARKDSIKGISRQ
jgi:hypothetical protein